MVVKLIQNKFKLFISIKQYQKTLFFLCMNSTKRQQLLLKRAIRESSKINENLRESSRKLSEQLDFNSSQIKNTIFETDAHFMKQSLISNIPLKSGEQSCSSKGLKMLNESFERMERTYMSQKSICSNARLIRMLSQPAH